MKNLKKSKSMKKGVWQLSDSISSYGLGIAALGTVIALAVYAFTKPNVVKDVTTMSTIMTEMRSLRSSTGYGTSDYSPALIASLGKSINSSGNKMYNSAGGEISVVGAGNGFSATTRKLDQMSCIKHATQLGGGDVAKTDINGTVITGEVSTISAQSACVDGKNNTLTFTTNS